MTGEAVAAARPYVLVNVFEPAPGRLEEFLELQLAEIARLAPEARRLGWRANRVLRALDGRSVVIVAVFDDAEAQRRWIASPAFAAHRERIGPLLERVTSLPCAVAGGIGDI